jgi:hypothetical protein
LDTATFRDAGEAALFPDELEEPLGQVVEAQVVRRYVSDDLGRPLEEAETEHGAGEVPVAEDRRTFSSDMTALGAETAHASGRHSLIQRLMRGSLS